MGTQVGPSPNSVSQKWKKREALPGARILELRGVGGRSEVSPQDSGDRAGGIPSDFGQSLQSSYSCTTAACPMQTQPPASCGTETGLSPSFGTNPTWALGEHHCSYTLPGACRAGGSEKPGPDSASVRPALTDPAMAAVGTYTCKDSPELGGRGASQVHLQTQEARIQAAVGLQSCFKVATGSS